MKRNLFKIQTLLIYNNYETIDTCFLILAKIYFAKTRTYKGEQNPKVIKQK